MTAAQEARAIRILDGHRTMAISTNRPDGWPQTTMVGYANVGLLIYFLIFRSSQKFANITRDDRVSIAVAPEPNSLAGLQAVYAGALSREVTDEAEREAAWALLVQRHPNLANYDLPDPSATAMMQASCKFLSTLDFTTSWESADNFIAGE